MKKEKKTDQLLLDFMEGRDVIKTSVDEQGCITETLDNRWMHLEYYGGSWTVSTSSTNDATLNVYHVRWDNNTTFEWSYT